MEQYNDPSWQPWLIAASMGAVLILIGIGCLVMQLVASIRDRKLLADVTGDPYDGRTLEWATSSPPPHYNFAHTPFVRSREPLWEEAEGVLPVVHGLRADTRELLVTGTVSAEPRVREPSPDPSIWPFLAALTTTGLFIGSIFTPWAVVWGGVPVTITLIGWFWPKGSLGDKCRAGPSAGPAAVEATA
jgi:hypothetical protein